VSVGLRKNLPTTPPLRCNKMLRRNESVGACITWGYVYSGPCVDTWIQALRHPYRISRYGITILADLGSYLAAHILCGLGVMAGNTQGLEIGFLIRTTLCQGDDMVDLDGYSRPSLGLTVDT
jgi:hypothetical protein